INVVLVIALGYRGIQLGYSPFQVRVDRDSTKVLLAFGVAQLCTGFTQQFLDLIVRTKLITQFGAAQNGYYQSALLMAGQIQAIVLNGVGSYALASLGHEADRAQANASSHLLLRATLPVATLAFGAVGIFVRPLLVLLYSASFAAAVSFVPFVL